MHEEQEEDVEEQDDQVGEDDKEGKGTIHATFVADPTETTKPQLQENEKPSRRTNPDNPGKDEGEDEGLGKRGGDDPDEKKKRRTPNTYLPQANQRSIGAPSK